MGGREEGKEGSRKGGGREGGKAGGRREGRKDGWKEGIAVFTELRAGSTVLCLTRWSIPAVTNVPFVWNYKYFVPVFRCLGLLRVFLANP